jgi:hypothetical protein
VGRLRYNTRTVHELTRTLAIPHRRLPGARRRLFRVDEFKAWEGWPKRPSISRDAKPARS